MIYVILEDLLFNVYLSNVIPTQPGWVLPVKMTCLYIKLCHMEYQVCLI